MPEDLIALTDKQIQSLAQKLDSLDLTESDQAYLGGLIWCGTQFLSNQIEEERKRDPEGVPSITFQPVPSAGECLLSALVLSEAESEVEFFNFGISCVEKPVFTVCVGKGSKVQTCVEVVLPTSCTVTNTDSSVPPTVG